MWHYLILVLLFLTTTAIGQSKDIRAKLHIEGRIKEISVSPKEAIWLTSATGNTYYTKSIDSNWNYGSSLFKNDNSSYKGSLERISFF